MTACEGITDALKYRDAWNSERSAASVAPVGEPVRVGDPLRLSIEESGDCIGELSDRESKGRQPAGRLGEFTLREPSRVGGLERVALGMHQEIDLTGGVLGSSHIAEPTDGCASCVEVRGASKEWESAA